MPRIIETESLIPVVAALAQEACYELRDVYVDSLRKAAEREASPYGAEILRVLVKNAEYAKKERMPCCQDTGFCVVFMEIGQEVSWKGRGLFDAVNEGVRRGYIQGYLRKSIVTDPFTRLNSNDNTPAVLHTEITEGDKVVIKLMPKGGGSENSGAFTTLLPGAGKEGVKDFVIQTVKKTGGKSCPPVSIGVGIGGTMDLCCRLAKQALFRPFGERNPDAAYARFEEEILESVNDLGIGPMGCGGLVTALDARVEVYPCHITALPVAVNFQCHAFRLASAEL